MQAAGYDTKREQLATYFDRTAVRAWERLTSDEPVGRIRSTVRAGREEMRATLLSRLPHDLRGARLLDAGCGTGALAVEAAQRGAEVVAIDVAANLIEVAQSRAPKDMAAGSIDFRVGDMCSNALGSFDYVVAMDSLIHYELSDIVAVLERFTDRTSQAVLFTFAPRTKALAAMHFVGRLFPTRSSRAPAIAPVAHDKLEKSIEQVFAGSGWQSIFSQRIDRGFYISQALELSRS